MTAKTKRVAYLFGAGATCAEAPNDEVSESLKISSITNRVFARAKEDDKIKSTIEKLNKDPENLNIEQLISLIESFGTDKYREVNTRLRQLFQSDIENIIETNSIQPNISKALLMCHLSPEMMQTESLTGIMTLNYDNLLDKAFCDLFKDINYGIRYVDSNGIQKNENNEIPPLLKLHGSFNWKTGNPIELSESATIPDTIWIPPSISKDSREYPYNRIWGRAHELLDCDILRIVGCSLNQNDWGVLSLLFKTQFLLKKPYEIHLIINPNTASDIISKYGFLSNIVTMDDSDIGLIQQEELDENGVFIGSDKNFFKRMVLGFVEKYSPYSIDRKNEEILNKFLGVENEE